jgi:hypothetical protein
MKIWKIFKILNKDCGLSTKPSYKENFAHVQKIWDTYYRPHSNLDAFFQHIEEYKVTITEEYFPYKVVLLYVFQSYFKALSRL